jgi:hypothetical protein
MSEVIEFKEVELGGKVYVVYLKKVATKLGLDGKPESFTVRAFIRKKDFFWDKEEEYV